MNLLFYHEQSNNQKLKTQKLNKDHFSGLRQFLIFFRENVWDWSIFKVGIQVFPTKLLEKSTSWSIGYIDV